MASSGKADLATNLNWRLGKKTARIQSFVIIVLEPLWIKFNIIVHNSKMVYHDGMVRYTQGNIAANILSSDDPKWMIRSMQSVW